MNGGTEVQRETTRDASLVDWEDLSAMMSLYTVHVSSLMITDGGRVMIRHLKHLKCRLNEQSHPELRHKIQCEQCFSTGGSGTRTRTERETTWRRSGRFGCIYNPGRCSEKCFTDQVNLNEVDLDPAAAEKHRLRIIIIIIIVIIIILWYNKDI